MSRSQPFAALIALVAFVALPPAPSRAESPDDRIKQATEAIRKNPKDEAAHRNRAIAHAEKRDYAQAIADLTRAKELADGTPAVPPADRRAELRQQLATAKVRVSFQQALVKDVGKKQQEALKNDLPPAIVAKWGAALADAERKLGAMEDEVARLQKELDKLPEERR